MKNKRQINYVFRDRHINNTLNDEFKSPMVELYFFAALSIIYN